MNIAGERRRGVDWAKLDRIERAVQLQRARAAGLYERMRSEADFRRQLVSALGLSIPHSQALTTEYAIDWNRPVEGLRRIPRTHWQALGIDPQALDEIEALDGAIDSLRQASAAAEREVAPQVQMLVNLKYWAHHG